MALTTNQSDFENFDVFQNNDNKVLVIQNPILLPIETVQIFDIVGKLILEANNLDSKLEQTFSTASFSDGIYIVRIKTTEKKIFRKKVLVKN